MNSNNFKPRSGWFHWAFLVASFAAALCLCRPAMAQQCDFYPIALSAQQVSNAVAGTVLNDIYNGSQPGNFGWLSWGGSPSETALVASLTAPGNSSTYVNPDNHADHQISIGDWISGKPGVSNSKSVRDALDALKATDITIPVWDLTRGVGDHAAYRVATFARVRLLSYQLAGQNRISARFLGLTTCGRVNVAPVVNAGPDVAQTVHTFPVTISLTGSVSDDGLPNGTLTSSWSVLSGPGTVTLGNSSAPTTSATFSSEGVFVLQLSGSDGEFASTDTAVVTINRTNQGPMALSQSVAIDEDTTANITLDGNDPDGDPLTFQVVALPQFGNLSGTPPQLIYTPKPDYNGSDSFTFKVNDGLLDSSNATVNITIRPVNDAPVADSISVTNNENASASITLSGSDVEGSSLTYVLVTSPTHGTLNAAPGVLGSAQLTYTPAANFSGADSFTFKVNDGELDSAPATVSITVVAVNQPPDVDAGADQVISEPTDTVTLAGVVTDDNFPGFDSVTVQWSKVSGPGDATFADASSRTTTATFSASGVYVLRLTATDGQFESSDDVQITFNGAPVVRAGDSQMITLPASVTLNGAATDDGLPVGSTLNVSWEKVSGPGAVVFDDVHSAATTATFSDSGVYVLRLNASDSLVARSSDVTVTVNQAPMVDAGSSQLITNLQTVLTGTAYDDGLPGGTLTTTWTELSGPGVATFANSDSAATTVTFSESGVYVLQLSADDSFAQSSARVTIVVDGAPTVSATSDSPVNFGATVTLSGTATDDGLPVGSALTYSWSQVSGPGEVTFGDATALQTTASFTDPGTYQLQFSASDSLMTSVTTVAVIINAAPTVSAGANEAVNFPAAVVLNGTVTDDGNPEGATVTTTWSQVSGPGTVSFADIHATTTTASASQGGVYVLRLTANDTLATSSSDVTVKFNRPPVAQSQAVSAGEGQPAPITLLGSDPDGDALEYFVTQTPLLGVLSGSGASLTYTANVGTYGADSFQFYVSEGMRTSAVATVSIQVVPFGRGRTYTLNSDFQAGNIVSLQATNDQLQSSVDLTHFNYVWVPVQSRGTIMRLDAEAGRPLGEYRLYPDGRSNGFPSRVAVDSQGNCWVANERDNSVLMIATPETAWVDKNHNGVLDTSQGQGDIRPWTNPSGVDSNGGTTTAQDELIVRYVRTSDPGARFIGINANDDVWVGGTQKQVFDLIDHTFARITRTEPPIGRGGFGGFLDQNDVLWSAGTFLRWDTHQPLASVPATSWTNVPDGSFSCAKDPSGNIWVTYEYGRTVLKFDANGTKIGEYTHGDRYGQGVTIDSNGDVWIAHSHCGNSVGHLKNDGTYVGSVPTAHGPTAVSFDRQGRLWVSTTTGVVQRINPLGGSIGQDGVTPIGVVEMTSPFLDGYLWTYGNFTGSASALQTQRGSWTVVFDSGLINAPWTGLSWDGLIANDGDLSVSVATSYDGTTFSPLQPITFENSQPTNTGRYLKVVVNFVPASSGEGPTLQDMNVGTVGWPVPAAVPQWKISAGGDLNAYWPDAVHLKGVVWHSAHKIAVNPTIQWTLLSGPGTVTFDNPNAIQPTVHFSTDGTYQFRITANNNGDIKTDDMTVTLTPYNHAPWADAGPNLFVQDYTTGVATLAGTVRDDGLPLTNTLKVAWTQLFGPGTTTFANSNSPATTATFSTNGIYVLQLSGDDGEFVSKAIATVRVGVVCSVNDIAGLEAWWQANASGDDHVNGNQAFLENGANYAQGEVGPAFNFDGVNARVSVGANPHINLAKTSNPGFTVECWINPNTLLNGAVLGWTNGVRFDRISGGSATGDTLRFYVTGTNSGQYVDSARNWNSTASLNKWYHYAATYDRASGTAKVYFNGILQNSAVVGTNAMSTSAEFYMGQIPGVSGAFKGQLDEVSLYGRVLDPEEIYNIFASGSAGKCPLEGNLAPVVDAGPDLFIKGVPATATLTGKVSDDGLPMGSSVRVQWTKVSGPGTVTFTDATSAVTAATFSSNGVYVLQLAADDGDILSTSLVEVRVESLCTVDDPQGLAAWWTGNNNDLEMLNGYDAVQGSGASYTNGKVASAFSFNGLNNFVWMLARTNYDVGPSAAGFTVELWANPNSFQNGSVLGWANGVRVERWSVGSAQGDSLRFFVGGTNAGQYLDGQRVWPSSASLNQWYHIALTYDRTLGQAKIYTNGVLLATGTVGTGVLSTAGDFYLGQVPGSAGFFSGGLDEVSIYKRPLNPEEVYSLFASGGVGKCPNDANQPPIVNAGADLFVRGVPGAATLNGEVLDDNLPAGSSLRTQWSKFSGPGTVTFSDSNALVTTATFSTNGIYVLRLSADDGEAQASDLMEVRVETLCTVDHPQGLAAWWSGNGTSDDLINGYHGLMGSGTSYTNGKVASAFTFNGVNNYVWMSPQPSYNVGFGPAGFTLEFWANPNSFQNGSVLGWANGVRVERWSIGSAQGDSLRFFVAGTNSGQYLDGPRVWPSSASLNQWYHIALTYDRTIGQARIYTNGVLLSTGTLGTNVLSTAGDFYLGQVPGSANFFSGGLDEISIYQRPLSPEEVYNVFTSGSAGKCPNDANQPPVVYAGPDQTLSSTNDAATLNGFATDDGLPTGSTLRTQWSRFVGPGVVTFNNSNSAVTTATFSTNGLYVLQLTGDDSEARSSSTMQVRVGIPCGVTDPAGLVAFWPGNGDSDDVINGYHALLVSGTTYTNGKVASAFKFNGVNNYVWMPAQTNYNVGPSAAGFSMEFWMNPNSFQLGSVLGWGNGVRAERWTAGSAQGDSLRFFVAGTNSGQYLDGQRIWPSSASLNQWYHIALTYDRTLGQAKIYTNGVLLSTATVGANPLSTTNDFYLGQVPGSASFFSGVMDEVSLYNRPLTLSEVKAIFNAGAAGKCITPRNQAPFVSAGGDRTIYLPTNTVTLSGAAFDDGLPSNALSVTWTYISGPGYVFFGGTNTAVTTVTFTNAGVYTFQLSGNDGQYTTTDTATVTVLPDPRSAPSVSITTPANGATIEVPASLPTTTLTVTAAASDTDGVIAHVDWYEDSALLATQMTPPYSMSLSNVPVGLHTFTAVATDNDGLSTTSAPVALTVYVDAAPAATIFTPDEAASITAPTAVIGTASSPILQSYQLQYRFKAPEDAQPNPWQTFATGNSSVLSNTVAVFDPTLLMNGIYEIQLRTTDLKGRTAASEIQTLLVSRNLKVGNFTMSFSDLTVPLAGVPIQIVRTYDSRDKRTNDFGVGWSLDIRNVRLQKSRNLGANWFSTFESPWYSLDSVQPRRITVTLAGDKAYEFESVLTPSEQFGAPIAATRMTFTNLPGTYGTLEIDGDNKADVAGSLGFINLIDFTTSDYFNPTRFKFTTAEGDIYVIDEKEGLKTLTDRNGNTLTITTNGIFHSSGVSVSFTRDPQGRIIAITDPAGNQLNYVYGTNGSLASFTDRETNTTTFAYTNAAYPNYLTEITDPRGVKAVRTEFDDSGRMIREIDGSGNVINFTHDLANNREIITDCLGNVTVHEYDERGNVVRSTDALGNVTTHVYDDVDNELQKVDALGNTNTYTYDTTGNKLTETDPLGYTTRYTYGPYRVLTSIKNARGFTSTNSYDPDTGNLLQQVDPLGNVTSYSYDGAGDLLSRTDALGNVTSNRYDQLGHMTNTVVIDAVRGVLNTTAFSYDTNGNQIAKSVQRTTPVGVETLVIQYRYDKDNRLVQTIYPDGSSNTTVYALGLDKPAVEIDPIGHQTLHFYDERGNVTNTVFADLTSESTFYDAENRKIAMLDRAARAMFYTNDPLGRLTAVRLPDGAVTNTYYDPIGRIIATQDERGNVTRYAYDPNCGCSGRQAFITNALGQVTHREYDENANESAMTDALGRTTSYIYDELDRRTKVVFPDGTFTLTTYDALGRRIAETDQNTNTTWFAYDALSRLVAVTNALGKVTTYTYDELGSLTSQTDANLHTTRFEYDAMGRRTKRTLPLGQIETYRYDLAGNLTNKVDFNGHTTVYAYDALNRLLSKTPDQYFSAPPVVFTYTPTGQRATMTDASGATIYQYDSRDFLTNKTWSPAGQTFSLALNYAYDPHGDVTRIHSTSINGVDLTYDYDALNRLGTVTDAHTGATTYGYDAVGNLAGYTYPNGLTSTYQYDSLNRLTNLSTLNAQHSTVASYIYTVAPSGHRLTASENLATTNGVRTINRAYTYDATYRLLNEAYAIAGPIALPPTANIHYTVDDVGNRLTRTSTMPGVENQILSYDANDRLTTDAYDANGNTTVGHIEQSSPAAADQYDFEDHLINRNNGQVVITYDGDGNRLTKTANGITTLYLVDDRNPTGYAQVLEELTMGAPSTPTVERAYAYGTGLISQQLLSSLNAQPSTCFYGHDGHGNVRYLTSVGSEINDIFDFDAFGNVITQIGSTPNNYLYCGEQFDRDLALSYNRARYLNLNDGRFWGIDKSEGKIRTPGSLNGYLYGTGDSVNVIDPSGYVGVPDTVIEVEQDAQNNAMSTVRVQTTRNGVKKTTCLLVTKGIQTSFQILDYSAFPKGVPYVPGAQYVLIEQAAYQEARALAEVANQALRKECGLVGDPGQVHEMVPVRFGGSPTDPLNKVLLQPMDHGEATQFFNWVLRIIKSI